LHRIVRNEEYDRDRFGGIFGRLRRSGDRDDDCHLTPNKLGRQETSWAFVKLLQITMGAEPACAASMLPALPGQLRPSRLRL
jgi:hypothetical protein